MRISVPPYTSATFPSGKNFLYIKGKLNFTPEQATKAQRGSSGLALLFL
jgi:hypothetical protein